MTRDLDQTNNLFYADSLSDNRKAVAKEMIGFYTYEINEEKKLPSLHPDLNHLLFVLDGSLRVNYNEFQPIEAGSDALFLLPKSAEYTIKTRSSAYLIVCSFDSLNEICNKHVFRIYASLISTVTFDFRSFPIRDMLKKSLIVVREYLRNGIDIGALNTIKFQELFLLFSYLYNKDEMTMLFYPILGRSPDFKSRIMQYFPTVNNVDELAQKVGMGRGNFDLKFKKEFGMTPHQWILKEKAKHVYFSLSEPDNTLSDIMQKYNFNSPTHLNRFCKQQFGCSPSELKKRLTTID
jgi:AraC-like DNA-binding protein